MAEQQDFPMELRAAAKGLDTSMPYTRDLIERAASEIDRLQETDARRFKLFQARNEEIERLQAAIKAAPEAVVHPSLGWCDAYADWVAAARPLATGKGP